MKFVKVFALIALSVPLAISAGNDSFDLKAARVRVLRDQPGNLHIDAQGVTFRSVDGKTSIRIVMENLREADVADSHALHFQTYEVQKWKPVEWREYTFRAQPDAPVEELAKFLAARILRPVVGHYQEDAQFKVGAFHRRTLGGTSGMLEIGQDSIQFVSDKPADSRTWPYRDIETIGRPDSFRFRVTTKRETYVLELRAELPEAAYQFAWSKVYNVGLSR